MTAAGAWRGRKIEVCGVEGFAGDSPDYGGELVLTRIFSF
jgi:hypothetical protein